MNVSLHPGLSLNHKFITLAWATFDSHSGDIIIPVKLQQVGEKVFGDDK